ncbi:YutD family protein [Paenibacillus rhizoplanae]
MLDHKDGWNPEAFRGRYSEVLERYDYIIGDWGYSQLRLKGFYRDNHPKVNRDTAISGMVDYINEYCNFGCAYFVLHKLKESPQEGTFKDILIKEVPEPGVDDDLEQEDEPAVSVKRTPGAASGYRPGACNQGQTGA